MKSPLSCLFASLTIFALATPWTHAQNVGVPVKFVTMNAWLTGQSDYSFSLQTSCVPSNDYPLGIFNWGYGNPSGQNTTTAAATAVLVPDTVYTVTFSGVDTPGGWIAVAAPQGYQVLINKQPFTTYGYSAALNQYNHFIAGGAIQVLVSSPNALSGRAGTASSITSGQVRWQIALGYELNGSSAGALTISDQGIGGSWNVFTRSAVQYMAPSTEIVTYNDSTGLRQILADQADVDLVDYIVGTSYYINFYNPSTRQGSGFPYTHTGYPYVSYLIQQGSTATTLQITSTTRNLTTNSVARVAVTTLTRTGTGASNYKWVLDDWNDSGQSQMKEETRQWGVNGSGNPTETLTVYTPNSGTTDLTVNNTFTTFNWGEQLTATSLGSSSPTPATAGAFYTTASATNYAMPRSFTSATGTWVGMDYDSGAGDPRMSWALSHQYKPFNSMAMPGTFSTTQGEVTTFGFGADIFGAPTRFASSLTQINGTTTAETNVSYNGTLTAPDGLYMVQSTRTDYYASGSGSYLTTISQYYREDNADPFFAGQMRSVVQPDHTQVSYADQRGTFNRNQIGQAAFSASPSGTGSSIASITGSSNSSSGTAYSTYNGYTIDQIYLVSGKSTMQVALRDSSALVQCVQSYAWVGGSWVLVDYTNYTYDASGQLVATYSMNGAATSTTISGEQVQSTTDATGATVSFTYDHAGRHQTIAKGSGPTITYAYNSVGQVTSQTTSDGGTDTAIVSGKTYDDAGRLASETPAGLNSVNYGDSYGTNAGGITNATYVRTTTYTDGGTRKEAQQIDGRCLSVSGTAVVEQDYTYALDQTTSGYFDTTVQIGCAGSQRSSTKVTDWLGRTVSSTHPGFTGQSNYVETNIYDTTSGSGHLIEVDRTGYAPAKFQYDALGNVVRSGLDLGNDNLALASTDVIADSNKYFESYSSAYWLREDSVIYPTANSSTPLTTSTTRRRLTGFNTNRLAETQSTDAYGNITSQTVDINTGTKTLTTTTNVPGVTHSIVETVVNGLKTQVTDVNGLTTYLGYDGLDRSTTVTDSRNNTTTKAYYSGTALAHTVIDASSAVLATYGYDGLGRQTSIMDAGGNTTYYAYNQVGLATNQWGNGAYPVSYGYDSYGERTSVSTYRGGGTTFTSSSWPSNPPTADITYWEFDGPSGLLADKKDAAGNKVTYSYNAAGQTLTRTWARSGNIVTTYHYDTAGTGQLTGITYSDSTTPSISYAYGRAGQLQSVSDATGSRTFNYTNASQPLELDSVSLAASFYSSRIFTQKYNSDSLLTGRPTGFQLGNSSNPSADLSQTYGYNGQGYYSSLTTVSQGGANSVTFNYGYLSNAPLVNSIAISGNSSYSITRGYNSQRDLVTSITNNWGAGGSGIVTQFNYGYNPLQQRVFAEQSGSAFADYYSGTSYSDVFNFQTYDSYGQLHTRGLYRNAPPAYPNQPSSGDLLPARTFQFDYDTVGNRSDSGEIGNAYDGYQTNERNQYTSKGNSTVCVLGNTNLTASVGVSGVPPAGIGQVDRNFGCDFVPSNSGGPAPGTLTVTATMPNSTPSMTNRNYFIPKASQTLTYDVDGNLADDGVWTYSYDAENRLSGMTSDLSSGFANYQMGLSYTYDYLNRRVEKRVYNTATQQTSFDHRYIYDGWNLIAETDTSGNIQRSYSWGLDLTGSLTATAGVGALLEITNYSYSGGSLVGTTNYFSQMDGNGNVSALVRSDGLTAAVYEYGPFGELLRNESFDSAIADNGFKFSTKFADAETGLVYYGNRFYSPGLGRFINRDPIEEAGGINLYGFCGNDSINRFDVLGNSWLSKLWDRTILSLGKHIAMNWDHARTYVIMAVAIVVSCFIGFEVAAIVDDFLYASTTFDSLVASAMGYGATATSMSLSVGTAISSAAAVIGGAIGGAVGGFISGVSLGAMQGQHLGQALEAGLKGAEYGAIAGGLSGAANSLNANLLTVRATNTLNSPAEGFRDLYDIAGRGVEGAVTAKLEHKNASAGFWSSLISGAGELFKPSQGMTWSNNPMMETVDSAGQGVVGGFGSMNKYGKGFMNGFWSAEAKMVTNILNNDQKDWKWWEKDPATIGEGGIINGAVVRFSGKPFSSGVFPGLASPTLSIIVTLIDPSNKKPSTASPTNSGFKLLQPKVSGGHVKIPLDSIAGGSWANGAPWEQLYAPANASGN